MQIGSRHEYVPTKKYEREFFCSRLNPYSGKAVNSYVSIIEETPDERFEDAPTRPAMLLA